MYLWWMDLDPKKTPAQKIAEAIVAYTEKFRSRPNVVLTNEAERCAVAGVLVRSEGYIRKNNFWIGWEDAARGQPS